VKIGIRQKMVAVLVTVLLLALGSTGWYTIQKQEENIIVETQQRAQDLSRFTARSIAYSVVGYDYHSIQLLLDEIVKTQDMTYAKVVNIKGNTMAESGTIQSDIAPWMKFRQAILFDDKEIGSLEMALNNRRIVEQQKKQKDELIQREVILIILIAVGEFLALSYIIVRPVSIISLAMDENVDENGIITSDINFKSRDEFGRLANQFNEMRSKLNDVTGQLYSRISFADEELQDKNKCLLQQSVEMQRINEELQRIAITDPLTNLYNRRHFDSLLEKEFLFSKRHSDDLSVAFFDIDHFKIINDKYGHAAGDIVLIELANLINKNLRSLDVVCRVGGEEFAIICRRTDRQGIQDLAEKIRSQIEMKDIDVGNDVLSVTTSFGLMTYPDMHMDVKTYEELVNCADMAMYYSNDHGRNRITHYTEILNKIESIANNIDNDEERPI